MARSEILLIGVDLSETASDIASKAFKAGRKSIEVHWFTPVCRIKVLNTALER